MIEDLKTFFRFPANMYWLYIVLSVSGLIAAFIVYIIMHPKDPLPSVSTTLSYRSSNNVFFWFGICSLFPMIVVLRKTSVYFHKCYKIAVNKIKGYMTFYLILHYIGEAGYFLGFTGMVFIYPKNHPVYHMIFLVSYYICGLLFHFTADSIYALQTKLMIEYSVMVSYICAGMLASCIILRIIEKIRGITSIIHTIFVVLEIGIYVLYSFKTIFLGIFTLGARFIPQQYEVFKKTKQNIFSDGVIEV